MKNLIYKISFLIVGVLMFSSCEDNEIPQIDVQNARAIAGFGGLENQTAIFDPSQDTQTTFTVGVSTLSSSDRNVQIRVSEDSTLDPSFYTISTLTPVIPAGEFTTEEVTVTTVGGVGVPPSNARLILELVSVEDAEILAGSTETLNYSLAVQCPSVDLDAVTGEGGNIVINELSTDAFGGVISDEAVTVLAGPGENQITIVGGVGFNQSEDLILNVDEEDGSVSYGGSEDAVFFFNGEDPVNYTTVSGKVLSCISQIDIQIAAPFGAPFDSNTFRIQF